MKNRLSISISVILLSIICLFSLTAAAEDTYSEYSETTVLSSAIQNGKDITVKWKKSSCDGYILRVSTKSDFSNGKEIKIENAKTTSYLITGKNENSYYYVDITPYVIVDDVEVRGVTSGARYTNRLSKISFTSTSDTVTLSWDKIKGATGYQIVELNTETNSYSSVKYVTSNSYTIKKLNPSEVHIYNVKPYILIDNVKCYGQYTNDIKTVTKTQPTKMTSLTVKDSKLTAKWQKVDCSGYVLTYATNISFTDAKSVTIDNPSTTSYVIKNINTKSVYYVKVKPYAVINNVTYSGDFATPRFTGTVTGVKSTRESSTVTLSWKKNNDATHYQICQYDSKTGKSTTVAYVSSKSLSYTVKNLKANTSYTFNVRPCVRINDSFCYGLFSSNVSVKTKPAQVSLTSVNLKGKTLTIKWKKASCSGYVIRYATKSDFSDAKEIVIKDNTKTSYVLKNRNKEKTYYVKVRAYSITNGKKVYGKYSKSELTSNYKVIATYSSYYVNNPNRTNNLILASKKIDGTVIQPGETFSFNAVVGERTTAKGYKPAPIFAGATTTENGVGGGICQVASTMFNTALLANVQIVERHQHSQRVAYVPLGRDAAIYWRQQDFKWKNTTNYPIKIHVTVKDGLITCQFIAEEGARPSGVSINVTQNGNQFTLKRTVKGKVNYTTSSRY